MSQGQSQAPMREVAQRAFAREFNDATYTFRESDDDRAPVYALLPTGAKANRVFVVGTLTETEDVGSEEEYWQGRIVDPTGTVFAYAGQYQPEAAGMLRKTDPPAFVAIVGKPRTYETDDGGVNVSLRPEHVTIVDETTRNRWVTETGERTLERIERFDEETNEYARMAREQYGDGVDQYRQAVIEAVDSLDAAPENPSADTAPASSSEPEESTVDTESESTADPSTADASTADASITGDQASSGETEVTDSDDDLGEFDSGDFGSGDFDSET